MAKGIQTPGNIEIAALKKRATVSRNLMEVGAGTPWEDRGMRGGMRAFWQTCRLALRRPVQLLHQIRRPETREDGLRFALACGACWGASLLIHRALLLWRYHEARHPDGVPTYDINVQLYWVETALLSIAPMAAIYLLLPLAAKLFRLLVATEIQRDVPDSLLINVLAYCLAPSVLALAPLVGPPIAVLWISLLIAVAGVRRMGLSVIGSIVATFITSIVILAIIIGCWLVLGYIIWEAMTGSAVNRGLMPDPRS